MWNYTVKAVVVVPVTAKSDEEALYMGQQALVEQAGPNPVEVGAGLAHELGDGEGWYDDDVTHSVEVPVAVSVAAADEADACRRAVTQLQSQEMFAHVANVTAHDPQPLERFGVTLTVWMPVYAASEAEATQRALGYVTLDEHVAADADFPFQEAEAEPHAAAQPAAEAE